MKKVKTKTRKAFWYSLDSAIASFAIPLLKKFIKKRIGYPEGLSDDEWDNILKKILYSLECAKDNYFDKKKNRFLNDLEMDKVQEGFNLMAKYFVNLWD